jgi:hypothetical protein
MADFHGTVVDRVSSDNWKELSCPGTGKLTFTVLPPEGGSTGGIVYQLGRGAPVALFQDELQPLTIGIHNRERICDAVKFKSKVAGKPAIVSIETGSAARG